MDIWTHLVCCVLLVFVLAFVCFFVLPKNFWHVQRVTFYFVGVPAVQISFPSIEFHGSPPIRDLVDSSPNLVRIAAR